MKKSTDDQTSLGIYLLFTKFVNSNSVYDVLFIICNTDTYLYDFYTCIYIKKLRIPPWLSLWFAFIYE